MRYTQSILTGIVRSPGLERILLHFYGCLERVSPQG